MASDVVPMFHLIRDRLDVLILLVLLLWTTALGVLLLGKQELRLDLNSVGLTPSSVASAVLVVQVAQAATTQVRLTSLLVVEVALVVVEAVSTAMPTASHQADSVVTLVVVDTLAVAAVVVVEVTAMDNGKMANTFPDRRILVSSGICSEFPTIPASSTLVSTSRSTTTFPLRLLARVCPSL